MLGTKCQYPLTVEYIVAHPCDRPRLPIPKEEGLGRIPHKALFQSKRTVREPYALRL